MEITMQINIDNVKELENLLQQFKVDVSRGVKEFESDKIHFRVLDKNELPIFKED